MLFDARVLALSRIVLRNASTVFDEETMKPYMLLAAFGACALDAAAQQAVPSRSDDPDAAVPAVVYRSAFKGYVAYREEALRSWREVNDEAGRVGGHAGVLSEAQDTRDNRDKPSASQPSAKRPEHGKQQRSKQRVQPGHDYKTH